MLPRYSLIRLLAVVLFLIPAESLASATVSWWPEQKTPQNLFLCSQPVGVVEANLAQSLSGLLARSINEGIGDTAVWIEYTNECYDKYLSLVRSSIRGRIESTDCWKLLEWAIENGYVDGFVLYDFSDSYSINVATVRASILNAVLVDRSIKHRVSNYGLNCLFDAREVDARTDFEEIKPFLNRDLLCIIDPNIPNVREMAIAHCSMVYYGVDNFLNEILEWCHPLSPVFGWNGGPESGHILPCSHYGLINTVSDYCMNLPLMNLCPSPLPGIVKFDPAKIDFEDGFSHHSFVMSDGDNLQWTMGGLMRDGEYWNSPYITPLSMNFTTCAVNMNMGARVPLYVMETSRQSGASMVEYGGGYYYPDIFADKRTNRSELLHELAKIVGENMESVGMTVLAFICMDIQSPESVEAYEAFAEEIPSLVGMMVVQYNPYNAGRGTVLWVKNRKEINIPVCSATYQVWANLNLEASGDPQEIAECINAMPDGYLGWTIVHAWSRFLKDHSGIFDADKSDLKGHRGVEPVYWGGSYLDKDVVLCSAEELMWRIRMRSFPEQTKSLINNSL